MKPPRSLCYGFLLLGVIAGLVLPGFASEPSFKTASFEERAQMLVGTWEGTFGGRLVRLSIESVVETNGRWLAQCTLQPPSGQPRPFTGNVERRWGSLILTWQISEGASGDLTLRDESRLTGTAKPPRGNITMPASLGKKSFVAVAAAPPPPPAGAQPVPAPGSAPPASVPQAAVAPAPVSPTPPAPGAKPPYRNSWALVIGVNAYQKVTPRLNYAVADAKAIAELLPSLGFPQQNIRTLLDGDATRSRIEKVLYQEFSGMGPEDRLFVYFSGHGETARIKGGEEGYILPVDADPKALPLTAIPMDDVKRVGQRVQAKHVLFVMDACFSGFAMTKDIAVQPSGEQLSLALREPVIQVLTAGRAGERAIEEGGHGLFTRRLIDGLRGLADPEGKGMLTTAQLAAWIEPRVLRDSKGKMTPQYGKLDGEGQFMFVKPGAPAPR